MRCCACDKRLEGSELYRKGWKFDMCGVCIPFTDGEHDADVDMIVEEADDNGCDIQEASDGCP